MKKFDRNYTNTKQKILIKTQKFSIIVLKNKEEETTLKNYMKNLYAVNDQNFISLET